MSFITDKINKYKYTMAIWTDKADFIIDKALTDEDKLLEIRCFDESGEFRAYHSLIGEEFKCREITDDKSYADFHLDEAQYLDIDTEKTRNKKDGFIYATGGGKYHLPEVALNLPEGEKMLLIRTYYKYDEEGVAHKCDWRIVGFTDVEKTGEGEE